MYHQAVIGHTHCQGGGGEGGELLSAILNSFPYTSGFSLDVCSLSDMYYIEGSPDGVWSTLMAVTTILTCKAFLYLSPSLTLWVPDCIIVHFTCIECLYVTQVLYMYMIYSTNCELLITTCIEFLPHQ